VERDQACHQDVFNVLYEMIDTEKDSDDWHWLERLATAMIMRGVGIRTVSKGQTALTISMDVGHYPFINLLIAQSCNSVDGAPFHRALEKLPIAVAEGDGEQVEFLNRTLTGLLKVSKYINEEHEGNTPLTLGIKNDARQFVSQLFARGCPPLDVNICSPLAVALEEVNAGCDEYSDLEVEVLSEDRRQFLYTCIYRLMENGADIAAGSKSVLIMGIDTLRVDLVKRMIDAGADINFMYPLAHALEVFQNPRASEEKKVAMERMAMMMLEHGALPNVKVGESQQTALEVAINASRSNLAKLLVRSGIDLVSTNEQGQPLLHDCIYKLQEAMDRGDTARATVLEQVVIEIVECMPEEQLNEPCEDLSPLDLALRCNNNSVTDALVKRGAAFGQSALMDVLREMCDPSTAFERKEFLDGMAVTLIEHGADVNLPIHGMTPLDLAIEFGSVQVVETLIHNNVNLELCNAQGKTPPQRIAEELASIRSDTESQQQRLAFLSSAAGAMCNAYPLMLIDVLEGTHGSSVGVQLAVSMIEDLNANTKAFREADGNVALHVACKVGALPVVRACIAKGANVQGINKFGQTPLIFAAYGGHASIVDFLLHSGADPRMAGGQYLPRMTALHEAALRGSFEIVRILIGAGVDVDAKAYWGRTALHMAVYGGDERDEEGRLMCVEALLEGGAEVNIMDIDGETALSYAVERGYENISEMLLSKDADPCGADVHGTTPVHHVIEKRNSTLFKILRDSNPGAIEQLGLLPWAVRAGWPEGVEHLSQAAGVVAVTDLESHIIGQAFIGGWMQPLWNAAYFNQIGDGQSMAEVFLRQTPDLDIKDHTGCTLLHRLVHWGGAYQTDFISNLLMAKASPMIKDDQHFTPLQVAVRLGNDEAARKLLEGGATVTAKEVEESVKRGDPGARVLLALGMTSKGPQSLPHCNHKSLHDIQRWCEETGLKYCDPEFPPNLLSLTGEVNAADTAGRYHDVEWVRAAEVCSGALLGVSDAVCGQLGDPFFVATLPDNAVHAFGDITKCVEGVYEVRVGDETVIIDDFVPAIDGQPQFTRSESGLMWPLLYEKACAKLAGNYDALSSIRRGGLMSGVPAVILPEAACPSERRAWCVKEFINPCLCAAALSNHKQVLQEFAQFFMDTVRPAVALDGTSRAMNAVGNYERFSFPMRTPALCVKVNSDTLLMVECEREATPVGEVMVVCVCEVSDNSGTWRLLSGTVAQKEQLNIELHLELHATGNKYIVFAGTPVSSSAVPSIDLNVSTNKEVEITYA